MAKKLIAAAVAGLVLAGAGLAGWYLFLREDAPAALELSESPTGSGTVVAATGLDGTWQPVPGSGDEATVAGYRVEEEFAGARKVTAAGRTSGVTGELTVADDQVTAATITVDMTTLESDEGRRDQAIKGRGLETDTYPEATFTLSEPIALPAITDGKVFEVQATGDLTLHGVTRSVTLELSGKSSGDGSTFTIQGSAPIAMADYDIEPPSVGGFVTVQDNGTIEFIVNFERA